jgi:mono/diheme cytochrome c family protein
MIAPEPRSEEPRIEVEIPVDQRPVQLAAVPPPAISGGTLLLTRDDARAVAADPDRDRVSIVSLAAWAVAGVIALEPGDEPGRLVEDDVGRVHVALRRGGAVVSIDVAQRAIVERRAVCSAPRGIAFEPGDRTLLVACAGGELMSLPVEGGSATLRARVAPDLRDVVIVGERVFVTRFKSAELIAVAADGTLTVTTPLATTVAVLDGDGNERKEMLAPHMAWRTLASGQGGVIMLHQGARVGEVALGSETEGASATPVGSPYGGAGGEPCAGVVQTELTYFDENGRAEATVRLPGVLGVDLAQSVDGRTVAMTFAGRIQSGTPLRKLIRIEGETRIAASPPSELGPRGTSLSLDSVLTPNEHSGCLQDTSLLGDDRNVLSEAVAVVRHPRRDHVWIIQNREPAQLLLSVSEPGFTPLALADDSVADTGHALFHHDAGGGIACASCHGEGGEDGHVWRFTGFGPRRTQPLNIGLEGTAPFHWAGDMPGIEELLEDVLVGRMGGIHQSRERVAALERWLFSLRSPPSLRLGDDPAALRGKALFEGQAQCATCHSGAKLTNNESADIGTGEALQVPSLTAIGHRAPWLHTGCANTLRERFDPACGGAAHGATADLDDSQLTDLIAYLETL